MTNREKVIRILEGGYKNSVLRHNGELLTVNELIELLKAQEPVKPEPGRTTCHYICGNCHYYEVEVGDKYCRGCGKAVKWE